MTRALLTLALLSLTSAAYAQNSGVSASCHIPRFGRWLAANVAYSPVSNNTQMTLPRYDCTSQSHCESDAGRIDANTVRQRLQFAANVWNNAPCCTQAPQQKPNLNLFDETAASGNGTNAPAPMSTGSSALFSGLPSGAGAEHPVWVARQDYPAPINFGGPPIENGHSVYAGTLGITFTSPFSSTNGANVSLQKAVLVFNGYEHSVSFKPIKWYTGSQIPAGCNDGNGCFNFETVAIHEFGHFLGYLHADCGQSVMYPSYEGKLLALQFNDVATVCSANDGYNHAACQNPTPEETQEQNPGNTPTNDGQTGGSQGGTMNPATLKPRYFECTADSECASFFTCRAWPTGEKTCDWPCTSNARCPVGEICNGNYCEEPPPSASGGSNTGSGALPADAIPVADFCAPCEQRSDCLNNTCVKFATNATPICTVPCANDADCGSLGTCAAVENGGGYCAPKDLSCIQQAVERRGQLNEACSEDYPCGPNLVCAQLRNSAVCLEYCDTDGDGRKCSTDGYDCLEIDSDLKYGVCFKTTAREGESCVIPDTALCGFTGEYQCTGTEAKGFQDAQCYKICSGTAAAKPCATDQQCVVTSTGIGVCNPIKVPDCPLADFGTKCSTGAECVSGFCATSGTDSACSHTCSVNLQTGCPKEFACKSSGAGDKGYCWPANNVVKPAAACQAPPPGTCGKCSGSSGDAFVFVIAILGLAFVRRRKGQ